MGGMEFMSLFYRNNQYLYVKRSKISYFIFNLVHLPHHENQLKILLDSMLY
jgi:hypothetical protein